MSRKLAREKAFECLFGQNFSVAEIDKSQWSFTFSKLQEESKLTEDDKQFVTELCEGVLNFSEEIKDILNKVLKGYSFDELYQSDKTVLMIAVYELKHTDIEKKIIINEAVEISKKYGLEKSPKFVNGVLSGVLKLNE